MLTYMTLASGSSGNASLVSCGDTHVLLDAGVSARRITAGLRAAGLTPGELSAILVTHEHHDHISGLAVLTKSLRVPIFASGPTCGELCRRVPFIEDLLRVQEPGAGVRLGELWAESFPTPHDAAGSVGYSLTGDGCRAVLCTDLGYITPEVRQAVEGCDLLVCEANHDEDWVRSNTRYPYDLKRRILGDYGHLSNEAGAELAAWGVETGTRTVVLAHLSHENNTPARAREAAVRRLAAMGCEAGRDVRLEVAPRSEPGPVLCLGRDRSVRAFPLKESALC